jgi:hypothetical protein
MREQQIEAIRKACIAANPEIVSTPPIGKGVRVVLTQEAISVGLKTRGRTAAGVITNESKDKAKWHVRWDGRYYIDRYAKKFLTNSTAETRLIRLADVLLVVKNAPLSYGHIVERWNLRADDLTQQSDETIEFIASLL